MHTRSTPQVETDAPSYSVTAEAAATLAEMEAAAARGDLLEAIAGYERFLDRVGESADVRYRLAGAYRSNAQPTLAIAEYRRAIELSPGDFDAHLDLGSTLTDAGEFTEGAAALERALAICPGNPAAMLGLMRTYHRLGEEAACARLLEGLERYAEEDPADAARQIYLSLAYCQMDRRSEGLLALTRASELRLGNPFIENLLGVMLEEEGRTADALSRFQAALDLAPEDAEVRFNVGTALLRLGELERGFAEYEARWRKPDFSSPRRAFTQPMWDGSELAGRTILLHTEQGLGDSIQFIRYAALLEARGGVVVVECEKALARLVACARGVSAVVVKGDPLPRFDVHAPLLSLPHLFGTRLETIPAPSRYLRVGAATRLLPARRPGARLRIGIAWEGSRTGANYHNKSCPLSCFDGLIADADLEILSLQKGEGVEALRTHPLAGRVHDLGSRFADLYETAEAILQLDLVVTVDTSVAHLAGALGVPTWTVLSADSDWRWLMDRADSPWYPGMTLFRQPAPRAWRPVFERIEREIAGFGRAAAAPLTQPQIMSRTVPRHAEARPHFDRAVRHQLARELAPAAAAYQHALTLDPNDAETHNNLGAVLYELGQIEPGLRHFERALELRPDYVEALNNLGLVRVSRREFADAVRHFQAALRAAPDSRDPLRNLVIALRESGNPAQSEAVLARALAEAPADPELMGMLASARADQGRREQARAAALQALELDPDNYDAHIVLGHCAMEALDIGPAIEIYDQAERIKPGESSAAWNRGYARLLAGDFELGWADFESRWRLLRVTAGDIQKYHERPRWDGSSLAGKSILLHCEQGFGDTIHFVRYAALLKERWDVRVVVQCQAPLIELLRSCPGVDAVVSRDETAPDTDVQAALLSLPHLLGTTLDTVPAGGPYLRGDPTGIEELVEDPGVLRVGIVWAGNLTHARDAKRSLHLGAVEHWAALPGVRLYSLQVGPQERELDSALYGDRIVNLGGPIAERKVGFSDTAAAVAALDLVITVDTSVAHLAGALGKPVWTMLPYLPDWRWLLDRDDSPWYPTMRLFRQPRRGDWASVIDRVTRELRELAAGAPEPAPESAVLDSAQRDESGASPFSITVPIAILSRESRFSEFEHELARGGAHAETRAFLEAKLGRNDVLVDVGAGLGLVSLSAATLAGREATVLAVLPDVDEAHLLLANTARNELTGSLTVLVAPAGSPPIDAMTKRPLTETKGWVFLRVGDAREAPGALAGAAQLVEQGRIAAFVWPGRVDRPADRMVYETLSGLGFSHFRVAQTADGPELMPYVPDAGAEVVISLGGRYLAGQLAQQEPETPSAPAIVSPATARHQALPRLGVDWQIGPHSGWGVYGLNLALHCLRSAKALPVLFATPAPEGLTPEQLRDLEPALVAHRHVAAAFEAHRGESFTFGRTLLRALGNQLRGAGGVEVRARRNVGVVFCEDTDLDAGALYRGRSFDRIIAGSTWNAELLRAAGLENLSVCLQGVDTALFHPGERLPAFGDRFVVFSGGKLEYRKGQDIVVAAFREFQRRHPDALLLTAWHNHWPESMAQVDQRGHVLGVPAVGADGRLDITGWVVRNGIPADSVLDVGLVPNATMAELVRGADVAVFPNRCEGGTNLVAMECMASGVPVILSANTGHLDLLAEERCYPLTRQDPVLPYVFCRGLDGWGESSVEEILVQMERAYQDREDARRRGAAAALFMSGFTWPTQIDRLLDAVGDLLAADAEAA